MNASLHLHANNNGLEGLYIFKTPPPSTTPNAFGELEEEQGSPWDWWDLAPYDTAFRSYHGAPAGYAAANSLLGNPDMSAAKGNAYLDTIQGYLNPRIYEVLDLANHVPILSNVNNISNELIDIYPNPANNSFSIVSYTIGINNINIYNTNGQLVLSNEVNANQIRLNTSTLTKGVYIVDIKSKDTSIKRKLIIE